MSEPVLLVITKSPTVRAFVAAACRDSALRLVVVDESTKRLVCDDMRPVATLFHLSVLAPESWAELHRVVQTPLGDRLFVLVENGVPLTTAECTILTLGAQAVIELPGPKLDDRAMTLFAERLSRWLPELRKKKCASPCSGPVGLCSGPINVIGLGASTGGPTVLTTILRELPPDYPVPVLVVQHMPAGFTRLLADRLNELVSPPVAEAQNDRPLEPGIWIAPGGHHLHLVQYRGQLRTRLGLGPPVRGCRPSVDVLFHDLAQTCGPTAACIVLTGVGADGAEGARAIYEAGGLVIAQDETSSAVWGMPGTIVRAGIAHHVLSPAQIASFLLEVGHAARKPRTAAPTQAG